jgi:hypothetical protein
MPLRFLIIPGNEIRCIWDGRGTCDPPLTESESFQQLSPNTRIHCVAALGPIQHGAVGHPRLVVQHIFELTPTIPLYPPGAPGSPDNSTYFQQQTVSPPQSPNPFLPMITSHTDVLDARHAFMFTHVHSCGFLCLFVMF